MRARDRLEPLVVVLAVIISAWVIAALLTPFSLPAGLRHVLAAPNCDTARLVGLAPAAHGQPGYYPQHDRDKDGRACEPVPWRRTSAR